MGLKETFKKAANIGFKVAGNIVEQCSYSTVTDNGIAARTVEDKTVGVIFGDYSLLQQTTNDNIQPGDVKGIILTTSLGHAPKSGDYLTKPDSSVLLVIAYEADPAGAFLKVQFRKP